MREAIAFVDDTAPKLAGAALEIEEIKEGPFMGQYLIFLVVKQFEMFEKHLRAFEADHDDRNAIDNVMLLLRYFWVNEDNDPLSEMIARSADHSLENAMLNELSRHYDSPEKAEKLQSVLRKLGLKAGANIEVERAEDGKITIKMTKWRLKGL